MSKPSSKRMTVLLTQGNFHLAKTGSEKKRVKHQTIPCCTDSAKKRANHPISSHSFLSLPKHPLFLAGFFYLYLLLSQLFAPISQLWFSSSLASFTAFPLSRTLTIPFITTYRGPLNKAIPTEKITSFLLFFFSPKHPQIPFHNLLRGKKKNALITFPSFIIHYIMCNLKLLQPILKKHICFELFCFPSKTCPPIL